MRWIWTAQGFGGGSPAVTVPPASFLRGYQLGGGYPLTLVRLATPAGLARPPARPPPPPPPSATPPAPACSPSRPQRPSCSSRRVRVQLALPAARPGHLAPAAALAITDLFTHRREGPPQLPATVPAPGGGARPVATAAGRPELAGEGGGQGNGRWQGHEPASVRPPSDAGGRSPQGRVRGQQKDTVRVPSADAGPSASSPGGPGTRTEPPPGPPPAAGDGRSLRKRGLALARRFPSLVRRLPSLARRHWLLALLVAAGLLLRVATDRYRPRCSTSTA